MAYIGVQPTAGQYRKLDNISASFNGSSTSFTTSVGGTNVTAGTAQQLIVSLGGVIQQPDTDYTVSTSTITFTTAPAAGLDFFAILMGDALNTVTPSDGSVTTAKLAGSLSVGLTAGSASTPALFFTGDTNNGIFSPSTDAIAVTTAGSERLRVTSAGLVGIGTNSPVFLTDILSGTANTGANVNNPSQLSVTGPNKSLTGGGATVFINSNTDLAADTGGSIALSGRNTTSSTNSVVWGVVKGAKENGTSGNAAGYLAFASANHAAGSLVEAMRIDSSQRVGIGTSSPHVSLQVHDGNIGLSSSSANAAARNWRFGANDAAFGDFVIQQSTTQGGTSYATKFYLSAAGNVGIGSTSPQGILDTKISSVRGLYISERNNQASITSYAPDSASANREFAYHGNAHCFYIGSSAGTSTTEAARIDSSSRLLVGTSTSVTGGATGQYARLQVVGNNGGNPGVMILGSKLTASSITSGSAVGYLTFTDAGAGEYAWIACETDATGGTNDYPGRLIFATTADGASTPTERIRIANDGLTTLVSANHGYASRCTGSAGVGTFLFYGYHSATAGNPTSGTLSFVVYSNGNVQNTNGSYTALSDAKLKENIVDAYSQWDDLKAIRIRNWNFKAETGHETHRQIGPIAQELEEVCPGLVFETPDRDEDGNETGEVTKGVNQSVLYMKAVKALQEAMERIETLEAKVAALESA